MRSYLFYKLRHNYNKLGVHKVSPYDQAVSLACEAWKKARALQPAVYFSTNYSTVACFCLLKVTKDKLSIFVVSLNQLHVTFFYWFIQCMKQGTASWHERQKSKQWNDKDLFACIRKMRQWLWGNSPHSPKKVMERFSFSASETILLLWVYVYLETWTFL